MKIETSRVYLPPKANHPKDVLKILDAGQGEAADQAAGVLQALGIGSRMFIAARRSMHSMRKGSGSGPKKMTISSGYQAERLYQLMKSAA